MGFFGCRTLSGHWGKRKNHSSAILPVRDPVLIIDPWSCRTGTKQTERNRDSAQTHKFVLSNLPAWTCNHTLDFCPWLWRMWRTVSVIVQSFEQIAHYCVRSGAFTFILHFPACVRTGGSSRLVSLRLILSRQNHLKRPPKMKTSFIYCSMLHWLRLW